jgi:hypothetical protein
MAFIRHVWIHFAAILRTTPVRRRQHLDAKMRELIALVAALTVRRGRCIIVHQGASRPCPGRRRDADARHASLDEPTRRSEVAHLVHFLMSDRASFSPRPTSPSLAEVEETA